MFSDLATLFIHFADAAAPAAQAVADTGVPAGTPEAPSLTESLMRMLPIILLAFGVMYLMTASQRKRQKEIAKQQSELKVGDRVVTTAGIFGKVVSIDGAAVMLQVSEGTRIPFRRDAVTDILKDGDKAESSDKK